MICFVRLSHVIPMIICSIEVSKQAVNQISIVLYFFQSSQLCFLLLFFQFRKTDNGIGFCVSGQTISSATKQIELAHYFKASHLILNVGSVDILNGQSLDDMCTDFDRLIRVCELRGCVPIVTTLAPIANNKHHSMVIHDKLNAFNFYLLNNYSPKYPFIDIWQQFAMQNGHIRFKFYETYAFTCFSYILLLLLILDEKNFI